MTYGEFYVETRVFCEKRRLTPMNFFEEMRFRIILLKQLGGQQQVTYTFRRPNWEKTETNFDVRRVLCGNTCFSHEKRRLTPMDFFEEIRLRNYPTNLGRRTTRSNLNIT